STQTGHSGRDVGGGRSRMPIQSVRASRYARPGYTSEALAKMWPWLKYQSETENESSATRSRLRNLNGRRRSARPRRNAAQKPSQTGRLLILFPPKPEPPPPRAIVHATCGPVHASVVIPLASSTRPLAISPAFPDHTFTSQSWYVPL